jgi:hypothetical protein
MAELISVATSFSTDYDTLIPQYADSADIREAFIAYHFGVTNFDPATDVPASDSIHGFMTAFEQTLSSIAASAVLTIGGTANEITVSGSAGFVTVGLPDDVTITDDLTVGGDLSVAAIFAVSGSSQFTGSARFDNMITSNKGTNIYATTTARNSALTSPVDGVLAYITLNDQYTVYNGSSWVGLEDHGTLGAKIDETQVLALLGL